MSKQLALSTALSVLAMAIIALAGETEAPVDPECCGDAIDMRASAAVLPAIQRLLPVLH